MYLCLTRLPITFLGVCVYRGVRPPGAKMADISGTLGVTETERRQVRKWKDFWSWGIICFKCVCVFILPACLYSEAGVFLSMERAGVTVEMTGLPLPGDGTESNGQENTHTDRLDIFNKKKNCFTPNRYTLYSVSVSISVRYKMCK